MSWTGVWIGFCVFIIIGALHPVVIKCEYYFGKGCWPAFALLGLSACLASLLIANLTASILLAAFGFSLFWSIHELFEQEKRVAKGWFPANPARRKK